MRIAMISDWYLPRMGGIEVYLDGLSTNLTANGHVVHVMTPVPGDSVVNGVPVLRLCGPGGDGGYRFAPPHHAANGPDFLYLLDLFAGHHPKALDLLRQALRAGQYDVAHVHLGNTPFSYLAVNICRALGLPVVATFHSVLSSFERPFAAIAARALGCRDWAGDVVLTAVSTTAAANRAIMFGAAPFQTLHNALDGTWADALRTERTASVPGSRLEFISVMRLHPRKRPAMLIETMSKLRRLLPKGQAIRLRIAGEGPMRHALARRIRRLGLAGMVELTGQLPRERVRALLAEADLFLMPSVLESFGIAALEARSAGVPVLAMRTAGAVDFLVDGVDGMIVDGDAAFVQALADYIGQPDKQRLLAAGARQPVTGFTWPDLVRACEASYGAAARMR